MLRLPIALIALSTLAFAQDARNTRIDGLETHQKMPEYKTLADWELRKARLRKQILFAAGLDPLPEKTPLHAQVFDRIESANCTIEKVLLETLPGVYLGGNLYRPKDSPGRHPAVLSPHGHWQYGRLENQPLNSGPEFGMNLARQGYVAFLWDMVGYNDTAQLPHQFGTPREQLWGFGPFGLQLWNSIRALDFVSSLDDVDPARIGISGASGGGTQTFTLAAVDDRIAFDAPVSMVSAIYAGGDICENSPGMRFHANNMEIAAMIAPKPMLLVAATGDWTRNTMTEELPAIRQIYQLYGKPENVDGVIFEAPHNFAKPAREAVYQFFGRHVLNTTGGKLAERNDKVEYLQNMLALANRKLPGNALTYPQIFEQWQRAARSQTDSTTSRDQLRDRLKLALAADWPANVAAEAAGDSLVLSRPAIGDRIPGTLLDGKGTPALVVHPDGAAAARNDPAVATLRQAGRPVLLIDAFQTGSAVAPRDQSAKIFLGFNQSNDACRVQDILTALAFLQQKYGAQSIDLVGLGRAGIWARFAAAVAPVPVKLSAAGPAFQGSDDEFLKDLNIPNIQRAGGLVAVRRILGE